MQRASGGRVLLSNEREGHMDICQVEAEGEVEELDPESDSSLLCSPLPHPRTPALCAWCLLVG